MTTKRLKPLSMKIHAMDVAFVFSCAPDKRYHWWRFVRRYRRLE